MVSEIKLTITEGNKVLETLVKETCTRPSSLVKSLEEFQRAANAALTKIIENHGDSGDCRIDEEVASDDDEEDEIPNSPKKRKK